MYIIISSFGGTTAGWLRLCMFYEVSNQFVSLMLLIWNQSLVWGPSCFSWAFLFPTYTLERSPFLVLGIFGDRKSHEIGIGLGGLGLVRTKQRRRKDQTFACVRPHELVLHEPWAVIRCGGK